MTGHPVCFNCGRKITNPTVILGMELGPECAHKFAGLEGYLASNGITFPLEFPMVPDQKFEFFTPAPAYLALREKAAGLGIKLATREDWGKHPVTVVTGVKRADPDRIASFAETRAKSLLDPTPAPDGLGSLEVNPCA
jgi:hypothetical protein